MSMSPQQNETIGHFITRLKTAAEDCEYGDEKNNQIRDKAIHFIEDDSLKSKLFRTEELDLEKLIQVVSEHDKAIPLKANLSVNMVKKTINSTTPRNSTKSRCYRCNAVGHYGRDCRRSQSHTCSRCHHTGHFEICCTTKLDEEPERTNMNTRGQSSRGRGWNRGRQQRGRGQSRGRGRANVRYTDGGPGQVQQEEKGQDQQDGDFYVFSVNSSNYKNDIELILNNTSITGIIDSGSDCSLMSIETFKSVNKQGNLNVNKGIQNVYVYGSDVPLETVGNCEIKCKSRTLVVKR